MKRKSRSQTKKELREAEVGPRNPKPPLKNALSYWAFVCADGGKKPRPLRE